MVSPEICAWADVDRPAAKAAAAKAIAVRVVRFIESPFWLMLFVSVIVDSHTPSNSVSSGMLVCNCAAAIVLTMLPCSMT